MCKLTDEIKTRSIIIYNSLCINISEQDAIQATKIWIQKFSDKPLFAIRPFIDILYETFEISTPRPELQRSVLSALMTGEADLDVKEIYVFDDDVKDVVNHAKNTEFKLKHKGFKIFISKLLECISKRSLDGELVIRIKLFDNLSDMGVTGELSLRVKKWLTDKNDSIDIDGLNITQMKQLFHGLYVLSCEYIGPVVTDMEVANVIEEMKELELFEGFDPKEVF